MATQHGVRYRIAVMKLTYKKLQSRPQSLQSLTRLKPEEFEAFLPIFGRAWERVVTKTFQQENQKLSDSNSYNPQLHTLADKLLFILVYFRLYPTQEVQGFLFGLGQSQVNVWVKQLTRVLHLALGYQLRLPAREPLTLQQVLDICPSLEHMLDGTEWPINSANG